MLADILTLDTAKTNATEDILKDAIEHTVEPADNEICGRVHTGILGQGHLYAHTRLAIAGRPKDGRNLRVIMSHVGLLSADAKGLGETDCTE